MGSESAKGEDALSGLQRAVEDHPEEPANWTRYGRELLRRRLLHEALDVLTEAHRRAPDSPGTRYHLARALAENGRSKEAQGLFWSVCLEDPTLEKAESALGLWSLIGMALAYGESGDWKRSFDLLMPATTLAKEIMCTLAFISQQEGEHDRAAYLFSIGVWIAPRDADALRGAGFNKRKTGDLEASKDDLQRAVKIRPEDPDLWYELGLTLAAMRKGAEARPVFEKVLKLDSENAWAHYDLACLDALEDNPDAAFGNLNRAVDCGFRNLAHLEKDEDLKSVRQDPRWKEILRRIPKRPKNRAQKCLVFQSEGGQTVQ